MRSLSGTFVAALAALAASAPLSAAPGPLSDFRLPSEAPQPAEPRQGPVAPDVPESRVPGPTPAPAARATPTPEPATPRIIIPPVTASTPAPRPERTAPARTAAPAAPVTETAQAPLESGSDLGPLPAATPSPAPISFPASSASQPEAEDGLSWLWALAGLLAIGALGAGVWSWRRRQRVGKIPLAVPQIERPRLGAAKDRTPPVASTPAASGEPLQVALEPLRLSLTLMNAALSYRLEITNRGDAPMIGLSIGADMISAHASLSREEQLAGPNGTAPLQRIERLDPGESRVVEGEFRLPFRQIVPLRQGSATLLLPLARFRIEAEGGQSAIRAFVVGQPGSRPGAGLQPFRLDLGPRVYPRLAQRAFA